MLRKIASCLNGITKINIYDYYIKLDFFCKLTIMRNKSWITSIKIILICVIFILFGCSGNTTNQLEQLANIEKNISLEEVDQSDGALNHSLFDLIEHAQKHSTVSQTQNVQNILSQTESDNLMASLYPRISIQTSYGRSVFFRRDEENSNFRISPFATWDIIRLFEYNKIKSIGGSTEEIIKNSTALTQKQIMLEVIRLYQDYVIVGLRIAQIEEKLLIARNDFRTLELDLFKVKENPLVHKELSEALRALNNELQVLNAQQTLAGRNIRTFCNLEKNINIEMPNYGSIDFIPKTISEFLLLTISQSEGVEIAEIMLEIEKQKTEMVKTQRWLNFNFSAALGDLLSNPSSAIYSSLSWTYNILDMGDHNREIIRAQAGQILQEIEIENKKNEIIKVAGQAWINLIESASLFEDQLQNLNAVRKELMILEEKNSKGIFNSKEYSLTKQKLFEENVKFKIFHMNYTSAIIQYNLLSGGNALVWLE